VRRRLKTHRPCEYFRQRPTRTRSRRRNDLFQKPDEFIARVPHRGFADDCARLGLQGGVERERPMAHVLEAMALGAARRQWQNGIAAVERLHPGLFVGAKDRRMLRLIRRRFARPAQDPGLELRRQHPRFDPRWRRRRPTASSRAFPTADGGCGRCLHAGRQKARERLLYRVSGARSHGPLAQSAGGGAQPGTHGRHRFRYQRLQTSARRCCDTCGSPAVGQLSDGSDCIHYAGQAESCGWLRDRELTGRQSPALTVAVSRVTLVQTMQRITCALLPANRVAGSVIELGVGEVVEVRAREEILATLDEDGRLDSLPFMPEMLKYCGSRFRVSKRAEKACDRIEFTGMRRMSSAVHLDGVRCDGQAHGGCQAGCLIYWKDAWLRRVSSEHSPERGPQLPLLDRSVVAEDYRATQHRSRCTEAALTDAAVRPDDCNPGESIYSCQATELNKATTPLRLDDPRQYWRDVRSGNVAWGAAICGLAIGVYNRFQTVYKKYLPGLPLINGGRRYPHLEGRLTKTPSAHLHLQPGETVRVKSQAEILGTLDTRNRNRGLSFDVEMLNYCGKTARVLRRVDRIIEENTGRMKHIGSDCIILENVTCTGEYHQFCPRAIYPYWREIWLERVTEQ
jgi:hypothetical protein